MSVQKRTLRELRVESGLTQEEVAQLLGCTKGYYSMMERGKRRVPLEAALTLAGLYGVSVEDIGFLWPKGKQNDYDSPEPGGFGPKRASI